MCRLSHKLCVNGVLLHCHSASDSAVQITFWRKLLLGMPLSGYLASLLGLCMHCCCGPCTAKRGCAAGAEDDWFSHAAA